MNQQQLPHAILDLTGAQPRVVIDLVGDPPSPRRLSFTVLGKPKPKEVIRTGRGGNAYNPSRLAELSFRRSCIQQKPPQLLQGPLKMKVTFYFYVQDSVEGTPYLLVPDVDNLIVPELWMPTLQPYFSKKKKYLRLLLITSLSNTSRKTQIWRLKKYLEL